MENGADVTLASYHGGRTPLHFSVQNGHYQDSKLLLEYGSNIHAVDTDGNTPILACGKNGSTQILELLLDYKANPNVCILITFLII